MCAYILCVCSPDACTTHAAHYVRTLRMHAVINSQNLFMRENNNYHIFPLPPCLLHECAGVKSSLAACRGRVIYFDLSSAVVTKIQHWTFFQFCRGFSVNESITLQADEIFHKIFSKKKVSLVGTINKRLCGKINDWHLDKIARVHVKIPDRIDLDKFAFAVYRENGENNMCTSLIL